MSDAPQPDPTDAAPDAMADETPDPTPIPVPTYRAAPSSTGVIAGDPDEVEPARQSDEQATS